MTTYSGRDNIKNVLGQIPFTAELYWLVRQKGKPLQSRFSLKHLQAAMPELVEQATLLRSAQQGKGITGKNIFIFATLHYWIEHAALLGLTLAAQGHQVTLGFCHMLNGSRQLIGLICAARMYMPEKCWNK
jgi:hypothetical protein